MHKRILLCISWQIKNFDNIKMYGMTVEIIEAQQTRLCTSYKNTTPKLLKTDAAIWFNKMCKIKNPETKLQQHQN